MPYWFGVLIQVQLVGAMGQRSSMTHIIDVFRGSVSQQVCGFLLNNLKIST
jgi:hypothetical protein